jgi:predicted transcriptional regulator of viral defense system
MSKRGLYVALPLAAGSTTNPRAHEFLIAMHLVSPAAIAYLTALNHHGMTEQLPPSALFSFALPKWS